MVNLKSGYFLKTKPCLSGLPCPSPLPKWPTCRSFMHPMWADFSLQSPLKSHSQRCGYIGRSLNWLFYFSPRSWILDPFILDIEDPGDILSKVSETLLLNLALLLFNPTKPLLFSGPQFLHWKMGASIIELDNPSHSVILRLHPIQAQRRIVRILTMGLERPRLQSSLCLH